MKKPMENQPDTCRRCGSYMPGCGYDPLCDNCVEEKAKERLALTPCSALRDPAEAPKDGTMILVAVGWPWLVPAMWCEYGNDWVIASPQVDYLHGSSVRHFENETEPTIHGWLPMPKIPKGTPVGGFLPQNANVEGPAGSATSQSEKGN